MSQIFSSTDSGQTAQPELDAGQQTDDKKRSRQEEVGQLVKRRRVETQLVPTRTPEYETGPLATILDTFGADSEHSLLLNRVKKIRSVLEKAWEQLILEQKLVLETLLEPAIIIYELEADELVQSGNAKNAIKLELLRTIRFEIDSDMQKTLALLPKPSKPPGTTTTPQSKIYTLAEIATAKSSEKAEIIPNEKFLDAFFARALAWSSTLVHTLYDIDLVNLESSEDVQLYSKFAMAALHATPPQKVFSKTQALGAMRVVAPRYPQRTFPDCALLRKDACKQAEPPCTWQTDRCVAPATLPPYKNPSEPTDGRVGQEPTFQTNKLLAALAEKKQGLFESIWFRISAMRERVRLSELRRTAALAPAAIASAVTPSPLIRDISWNILKSLAMWGTLGTLTAYVPAMILPSTLLVDQSLASWAQMIAPWRAFVAGGGAIAQAAWRQLNRVPTDVAQPYGFRISVSSTKSEQSPRSILTRAAARRKREREQKKSSKASD